MCIRGGPEEEPAPGDHCMWSAVQAAIAGGWSTTVRFIAIMTVPAVPIAMLGAGPDTPLTAVMRFFF
ncbi:hypothetical protein Ait01nite_020150 [Actinoplanes italicus]|nr:hypothetical protein Ait01nite_020150 [Actinoplanes italicus]